MSWVATTGSISGSLVRDLMVEAIETRFDGSAPTQPIEWLSDNGSPYIPHDTRSFAQEIGLKPLTTAIRSPQSNGMAKAFVKTFKRDYVERMDRYDALTVMRQLTSAFEHYKHPSPWPAEDAFAAHAACCQFAADNMVSRSLIATKANYPLGTTSSSPSPARDVRCARR